MIYAFKKPRSLLSPLSLLLRELDEAIGVLYRNNEVDGVRPRFSMALIGLADHGPMTIRNLADFTNVTHGAMSQSVKAMKAAGMVMTEPGQDARSIVVSLSDKGKSAIAFLEAEWDATEAMLAELDADLPYPLTRVISDIQSRLDQEPFQQRLARHLHARQSE